MYNPFHWLIGSELNVAIYQAIKYTNIKEIHMVFVGNLPHIKRICPSTTISLSFDCMLV